MANKTGYNGNPNLKKSGTKVKFTKKQVAEYIKCKNDIVYFAENYFKIISLDDGLITIDLFDHQYEFLRILRDNRFVIAACGRQTAKSTTITIDILHYMLFNDYKTCAILANKLATAREIFSRVQLAFEKLPKWLQQGVIEWNKTTCLLENGSKVICSASSGSSIRGMSIDFLFVDEVAIFDNAIWDEFYTSTYPTISSGKKSRIVLVSTMKGLNHFYKLLTDAKNGRNDFAPFEADWSVIPSRDEEWKRQTIANTSEEAFLQEHCVSGETLLSVMNDGKIQKMSIEKLHSIESELVLRKYKIFDGKNYVGYKKIKKSLYTGNLYNIMVNGKQLLCTEDHRVMIHNEWVMVKDLPQKNISKIKRVSEYPVYDAVEVENETSSYNTNDIVSHNCNQAIGSSLSLISSTKLQTLTILDPIEFRDELRFYKKPEKGHSYVMVVDVSRGKGLDNSAFSVIDVTDYPFKQVATYYDDSISPLIYPSIIQTIARTYNEAAVLVETNDIGESVATKLHYDLEYPNVIWIKPKDGKKSIGVRTTKSVKAKGCSNLKDIIEKEVLIVNDKNTITELTGFIQKGSSYEADSGFHDDLVMGLVLFAWFVEQIEFESCRESFSLSTNVYGQEIKRLEDEIGTAFFIDDGLDEIHDTVIEDPNVWSSSTS